MTDRREILEKVANGELTPTEAAELLAEDDEPDPSGSADPLFPDATITGLRLVGAFRSATVVADPTVTTASVDGEHTARVEDGVLIVDGDDETVQGWRIETRGRGGAFRSRRGNSIRIGVDNPRPTPLVVRANPSLRLDAAIAAGALKVLGMRGPITAEVSAGGLTVEDVVGPLDLTTAAGPIRVRGRIASGEHSIRCEAGAVKVVLDPGSDVAIRARAALGRVSLPGGDRPAGFAIGSAVVERTIGAGTASMSIECGVGGIKVAVADEDRAEVR